MTETQEKKTTTERAQFMLGIFGKKELAIECCKQIIASPNFPEFWDFIPENTPDSTEFWYKVDTYWNEVILEIEKL